MTALHCGASQQLVGTTMELLEEDLTCPICCGLFEDPRVLPCSHSFCRKCLEGLVEGGNRGPSWRPPFKCPNCRKETHHNGANSLQVNYSLCAIVEKYNQIKVLPRMSLCKQHGAQPLNIFCATDLKLICGFCATTGDHKDHRFCALEDAYEQERAAFEELFRGMETNRHSAELLSCLETLETRKKKALQSASRNAEKVADYFDKLIRTLEHKKNEILSDFEISKLAAMKVYDPEMDTLSAALEEQRQALGMAASFRSHDVSEASRDPLRFLQQMQTFREKLLLVRETPLPSYWTDLVDGCLVHDDFDVKMWDSLRLREVDTISVPHHRVTRSHRAAAPTSRLRVLVRVLLVSLLLPVPVALLLLHSDTRAAVCDAVLHWGGQLPDHTVAINACRNCILNLIDTTVDFIGSCKLFY